MSTKLSPSADIETEESALHADALHSGDLDSEETEQGQASACRNCQTLLHGTFCHACGQRRREGPITFRDLGRNLADSLFDVERGFLYTLGRVFLNPGDVAKRYVRGERKTFTNPLTVFLLVATVVFLVIGLFKADLVSMMAEATKLSVADAEFEEGGSMAKIFGITSREEYGEFTFYVIQRVYSYIGIFYCLLIAVALRLFFARRTIAENVVFQLYTFTQINLFAILICTIALGIFNAPGLYFALSIGGMFVLQGLAGWSYWGQDLKGTLLNILGFMIGYTGTFVAMSVVGILIGIGYALLL